MDFYVINTCNFHGHQKSPFASKIASKSCVLEDPSFQKSRLLGRSIL